MPHNSAEVASALEHTFGDQRSHGRLDGEDTRLELRRKFLGGRQGIARRYLSPQQPLSQDFGYLLVPYHVNSPSINANYVLIIQYYNILVGILISEGFTLN